MEGVEGRKQGLIEVVGGAWKALKEAEESSVMTSGPSRKAPVTLFKQRSMIPDHWRHSQKPKIIIAKTQEMLRYAHILLLYA